MQQATINDKMTIKGEMHVSLYDTTSPEANALEKRILALINGPRFEGYREKYLALVKQMRELFLVREYKVENIIVTAGRAVVAQRLANDTTYTGIINYGALGTGVTTPANGDTQLTTEVFRKVVASASDTNNQAFIDFFYSKADTNGTYQEFGTFIDGTATANTGQMWTHALTGGWVKSASESMTVSCTYTIT
jgi:hypothetical protein